MRKLGGDSVKAALTHTWIQDTRDDPFMASRGFYFKAVQELAGLGGDTNFVKVEGEMQSSRRLPHGWVSKR
jgi:outer membrane protein insertion porin family